MKHVGVDVSCWKNGRLVRVQTFGVIEMYNVACYHAHISCKQPESRLIGLTCHRHGLSTRSEGDDANQRHGPNTNRNLLLQEARVRQHPMLTLHRAAHPYLTWILGSDCAVSMAWHWQGRGGITRKSDCHSHMFL